MRKKSKPVPKKFEIDEKTSELKIVDANEQDVEKANENIAPQQDSVIKQYENASRKTIGKQIIMNQLLGFEIEAQTSKKQKYFKLFCSLFFVVLVVGVLIGTAINDFGGGEPLPPWSEIVSIFTSNWYYLLLSLFSLFLCLFFKGLKHTIMCKSMTGRWHFKTCMETGVVGLYYNNITPLAVGGQPFEIYHLSKHGVHGGVASSMPIATYILNQIAFVILGILSLVLYTNNVLNIPSEMVGVMPTVTSILAIIGLSLGMFMPLLVLLFSLMPRVGTNLVKFVVFIGKKLKIVKKPEELKYKTTKTVIHNSKCLKKIATNPIVFISTFLLSFLEHFANCSIAYFTLKFFGFNWPATGIAEWAQVVQLCLILYAAISFIPTPGNSGAADLSFYLLFKTGLGTSGGEKYGGLAFPAMIMWRLLSFYSFIIIGFMFVNIKKRVDHKKAMRESLKNFSEKL